MQTSFQVGGLSIPIYKACKSNSNSAGAHYVLVIPQSDASADLWNKDISLSRHDASRLSAKLLLQDLG